jgi:SAM-dependent methyltransferase
LDFLERLTPEAANEHSLLALEHRHRYALAAELCSGLRVADVCCGTGYGAQMISERARSVLGIDLDRDAITAAERAFTGPLELAFEVADAKDFLARDLAERFDVIVLFEGLEHLEDPDRILSELARHERDGLRVLISLPNDLGLDVENPRHVTRYDLERARDAFDRFDDLLVLYQFNSEGSLIRSETDSELDGEFALLERGDPTYANHFIACVGFRNAPEGPRWRARMHLEVAPEYSRYVRSLERGNRELWRTNARLAGDRIGSTDSAAAGTLYRTQALKEELEALTRSTSLGITAPRRWARAFARRIWRAIKPMLRAVVLRILR